MKTECYFRVNSSAQCSVISLCLKFDLLPTDTVLSHVQAMNFYLYFCTNSGGSKISQMGVGHQPLILGQNPIILQDFCKKLHENERNWTGEAHVPSTPWDPPMTKNIQHNNLGSKFVHPPPHEDSLGCEFFLVVRKKCRKTEYFLMLALISKVLPLIFFHQTSVIFPINS